MNRSDELRVAFFGNCEDSWEYLAPVVERTLDPNDRVRLVAIVYPPRERATPDRARFALKRAADRIGSVRGTPSWPLGPWRQTAHLGRTAGVPVSWPTSVRDDTLHRTIRETGAQIGIVAGLNQIFDERSINALPPLYNLHPAPLPRHRGGSPEFWQLAEGITESAVTLHRIDTGIDTGPIVAQVPFEIPIWADVVAFAAIARAVSRSLVDDLLDRYPDVETFSPSGDASYWPRPTRTDKSVPVGVTREVVLNRARAVGWGSPLLVFTSQAAWREEADFLLADGQDERCTTIEVRQPRPFEQDFGLSPGWGRRLPGGGVLVGCENGSVFFASSWAQPGPTSS